MNKFASLIYKLIFILLVNLFMWLHIVWSVPYSPISQLEVDVNSFLKSTN